MLVHLDPPRIYLHDGVSICLVPRVRFIGPPDRFRGDRISRDTGCEDRWGFVAFLEQNLLSSCVPVCLPLRYTATYFIVFYKTIPQKFKFHI